MAFSPAGGSHGSHDTAEYRVFRNHLGPLANRAQFILPAAANELLSRELISTTEHTEAMNSSQPAYNRASKVMGSVLAKIKHDGSCFYKFIEALQASELQDMAKDLVTNLNEEKVHYVSVSLGGLQQGIVVSSNARTTGVSAGTIGNSVVVGANSLNSVPGFAGQVLVATSDTGSSQSIQGTNISIPSSGDGFEHVSVHSGADSISANCSSVGVQPVDVGNSSMVVSSSSNQAVNLATRSSQLRSSELAKKSIGLMPRYSSPQLSGMSKSSQVAGESMEFCIKPGLPLSSNPHIDACSELGHRPLRLMRARRDSFKSVENALRMSREDCGSDDVYPIQSTEETPQNPESSLGHHQLLKGISIQSSCVCYVKIQVLQMKLARRMSEIDMLKHELDELEKYYDDELKWKSEALQKRDNMIARRDNVIANMKNEIASKNKLARQLSEEIAEYEGEIEALYQVCQDAGQKQWIAEEKARLAMAKAVAKEKESRATYNKMEKDLQETEFKAQHYREKLEERTRDFEEVKQRAESYQTKIARLEKELKEVKQREVERKEEFVKISYQTVQSEVLANIQVCVADKNSAACSTWVPKLKILVERERKKAASQDDCDGVKVAEELAKKVERLLSITETASQAKECSENQGYKEDIRALDLVTPDKDMEYLLW